MHLKESVLLIRFFIKGEKVNDVIPLTHKVRGYIEDEVIKQYRELTERNDSQ